MRARSVNQYEQKRQRATPGPGTYGLPGLSHTGNYFYSKFRNSMVRTIGKVKRKGMNLDTIAPGPGQYDNGKKQEFNMHSDFNANGIIRIIQKE